MENKCSKGVESLVDLQNSILVLSTCDMENNGYNVSMICSCNFVFLSVP